MARDFFHNSVFIHTLQETSSKFFCFLISDFLAESRKVNKNQREISLILQCSFTQKTLFILHTSTHLTLKNICPCNTAKYFLTLKISQQTTTPFSEAQELYCRSTLKANVCIFLHTSLRKFLFLRHNKLLRGFMFYLLNNFLKAACFLGLVK